MTYYTFPHRYSTKHEHTIIAPTVEIALDRANDFIDSERLCFDRNIINTEWI